MIKLNFCKKIFLKISIIIFLCLVATCNAFSFTCCRCNNSYEEICYSAVKIRKKPSIFKNSYYWSIYPELKILSKLCGDDDEVISYVCWNCVTIMDKVKCCDEVSGQYYFDGFNSKGINDITKSKWGPDGLDVNGFNKEGVHIFTKTKFNPQGYDQDGCDKTGKLILKKNMYRFVGFIKD